MLNEMIEDVLKMKERLEKLEKANKQLVIEKAEIERQIKTHFSCDEYVLIDVSDLTELMNEVEEMKSNASNLEQEIYDLEYAEVNSICSYISDCSISASSLGDDCRTIIQMVEELLEVEQEAEQEAEQKPAKKAPAKKKTPKNDVSIDEIFKTNN